MITKEIVENYINAIINLAENSEDIVEAARLSSCLTLHFNEYYNVPNPTRQDKEFNDYANSLVQYQVSPQLLTSRHRFLSHYIKIRYDKEFEYHMYSNYREAFTKMYEKVTGASAAKLTIDFLAQWYLAEGRNHAYLYIV